MSTIPPYRDASLPVGKRVADLLSRMTLEEKAAQVAAPFGAVVDVHNPPSTGWGNITAALSTMDAPPPEMARAAYELQRKHVEDTRLGIPVLLAEETLLGLKVRDATVFPDAIAQAATWRPELIQEMANLIGQQMSALGVRQALSPLADVARDPRWGRVEETYGEDPYLVGTMATAFVTGLQNATPQTPVVATLKHFIGYSASDGGRNTDAVHLGPRELHEVHTVPFEMAIRTGGARGIMPSYSSIDGQPVTGSAEYLTDLLRRDLGFDGIVISDLEAVRQLETKHAVVPSGPSAVALGFQSGVDLELDNGVSTPEIIAAVEQGLLAEAALDRAVGNVLREKFRMGLFEQPYADPDALPESFDTADGRALARRIAEQSIVLLQNNPVAGGPLLPLSKKIASMAVIGPNADRPFGQLGNYSYPVLDSGIKRWRYAANPQAKPADFEEALGASGPDDAHLLVGSVPIVTFLDGIKAHVGDGTEIHYEPGSDIATTDMSGFDAAVNAAARSEIAIVVVGDQSGINGFGTVGEGLDSSSCELPGVQRQLVEAIVATGTPTIVVLSHGRAFAIEWMASQVPAIVSSFFGGEEAGSAVASVLFGDVNPAGRLPVALPRAAGAGPVPYGVDLCPDAYVEGTGGALFPFGHGLSYTTFEYRDLSIAPDASTAGHIDLSFTLTNTGDRAGEEVVQVYGKDLVARSARRGRSLVAFQRVELAAGASQRIEVSVPATMFALWDPRESWLVEPGDIEFSIGGSSREISLTGTAELHGPVFHTGFGRELSSTVTLTDC